MEDNSKSDEECAVRLTDRAWNRVLSNVTAVLNYKSPWFYPRHTSLHRQRSSRAQFTIFAETTIGLLPLSSTNKVRANQTVLLPSSGQRGSQTVSLSSTRCPKYSTTFANSPI
jgi:hypothetical protein